MLDTRRHIRTHALALNRHRDAVAHVQEELGSVKRVLKDVTGRPSSDFNRLLDNNKSRCDLCSQNPVPKVQGATPACCDLHSCRASRSSTIQPIPGPVRTPDEVVDTTETFKCVCACLRSLSCMRGCESAWRVLPVCGKPSTNSLNFAETVLTCYTWYTQSNTATSTCDPERQGESVAAHHHSERSPNSESIACLGMLGICRQQHSSDN